MTSGLTLPSLRRRLLQHVTPPLAVAWLVGSAISTGLATHFAQKTHDRSLLNDAYAIASRVSVQDGRIEVHLSGPQVSYLLLDHSDEVFHAVVSPREGLVSGQAAFQKYALTEHEQPIFIDIVHEDQSWRAVVLPVWEPTRLGIVIGHKTGSHSSWLLQSLLYSLLLQALLLLLLWNWLRANVEDDLQPLGELREAVENRDPNDLTPLPAEVRNNANSADIAHLGQSIDDLLRKVREGIDSQKAFAGNVAHELRTPLAGIRTLAEYGLRQADPRVWREQLEAIVLSQERASHIVDQLMALAFANEIGHSLRLEPVALDDLVRQVLIATLRRADAHGADLGAEGLDESCTVLAHPALLEGLLVNLLTNALRYGAVAPARPVITVSIDPHTEGTDTGAASRVWLCVSDHGPGLGPDALQVLRQRWAQGPTRPIGQGNGLGLDIVHSYAQLLGAELEFVSRPNGPGLCVRVGLQQVSRVTPASAPESQTPPPAPPG